MLCISDTQEIKEIGGTGKHARSKFLRDDDDDDDVGDDDAGGDDGEEVPQFYIYKLPIDQAMISLRINPAVLKVNMFKVSQKQQ